MVSMSFSIFSAFYLNPKQLPFHSPLSFPFDLDPKYNLDSSFHFILHFVQYIAGPGAVYSHTVFLQVVSQNKAHIDPNIL